MASRPRAGAPRGSGVQTNGSVGGHLCGSRSCGLGWALLGVVLPENGDRGGGPLLGCPSGLVRPACRTFALAVPDPPRTSLLEAPPGGCADCGLPAPSPVNASRQFQIVESGPRGALTYPGCDQVWCARVWMFAGASFGVSLCGGGRYVFLWRRLIFPGAWRGLRARWGMSGFGRGGWRGMNCCGLPRSTR